MMDIESEHTHGSGNWTRASLQLDEICRKTFPWMPVEYARLRFRWLPTKRGGGHGHECEWVQTHDEAGKPIVT